jgi:probable rRNA maturation factor
MLKHKIEIFFEIKENEKLGEAIENLIKEALREIAPKFPLIVSITLVDNERIREINRESRNIDKPTDVLSFPMLFWDKPEILKNELSDSDYDLESGQVFLGDIVISEPKAIEQAELYNHSFEREILYLTIHGLLHLFGYDHMIDSDKVLM